MLRKKNLIFTSIIALFLVGCAGVKQQGFNQASAPQIKRILIVTNTQPPPVTVGVGGSIGLMFGGVGAGLAAAGAQGEGKTLNQLIASEGLNYHKRLQDQIISSFQSVGIQAETISVQRKRGIDFVEDYKTVQGQNNVDAILDLIVLEASYGGTHPLLDPKPRPILKVKTQLVSAKTSEQLYGEAVSFGYSNPFESATELKAPSKFYFSSMEAVGEDKKKAAEGLALAVDEVARHIVKQFAGNRSIQK